MKRVCLTGRNKKPNRTGPTEPNRFHSGTGQNQKCRICSAYGMFSRRPRPKAQDKGPVYGAYKTASPTVRNVSASPCCNGWPWQLLPRRTKTCLQKPMRNILYTKLCIQKPMRTKLCIQKPMQKPLCVQRPMRIATSASRMLSRRPCH